MKQIRYLIVFLLLLLMTQLQGQTVSQETGKHQISLGIGYNQGYLRDRNFSPLRYTEGGLYYGLRYEKQNRNSRFIAQFMYSKGTIKTAVSPVFTTDYILGNLSLGYLRAIPSLSTETFQFLLGPQYSFYIYYLDWENQDAFSFMANHSLDITAQARYQLGAAHRLSAQLGLPAFNLLVRPPYNGNDEELGRNNDEDPLALITDGVWGTWNKLFAYHLALQYHYAVTQRIELTVGFENRYQRTETSFSYRHAQHHVTLGFTINL